MSDTPTEDEIKAIFEGLATAPRRIFELCSGVAPGELRSPIAEGKWSPLQIIQHLIGCDREALLPRIEKMLATDNPELPAWDQDAWMRMHGSVSERKAVELIDELARLREKSVSILFDLSVEQWQRTGQHGDWGETSIFELCKYFVKHDTLHYQQIAQHLGVESS